MMQRTVTLATILLTATSFHAQAKPSAAIPATQPTQSVSDLPSAHMPVAVRPDTPTRVTWSGSLLTIESSGEPLPEVLGRVARETGMKITGGVPDEHLFGKYGPGSVQVVLGQLFEGLSINMMLVNNSPTKPKELILTARTGGPTPPSTRQAEYAWQSQERVAPPIEPIAPLSGARPLGMNAGTPPNTDANSPVTNTGAAPDSNSTQPAFPALAAPPAENNSFTNNGNSDTTPPASTDTSNGSTTQPQSPNGTKTPEQIFEELRRRQQGNPQ